MEYKLKIPDDKEKYLKSAVAFANAGGGKLIFGVKNQTWDVIGFADDEVFQKYDAVANILPGMDRPYYLRADGMMAGTYIRIAGVTRKAEPYMVKELQLEGANKCCDATQAAGEEVSADDQRAVRQDVPARAFSLQE